VVFKRGVSGVEEAVKCYSINSAYASFEDHFKGSLEEGKLADIVILDRDLSEIPANQIKNVHVYMTIVDGKILYIRE